MDRARKQGKFGYHRNLGELNYMSGERFQVGATRSQLTGITSHALSGILLTTTC